MHSNFFLLLIGHKETTRGESTWKVSHLVFGDTELSNVSY